MAKIQCTQLWGRGQYIYAAKSEDGKCTNSVDPDETPYTAASHQGLLSIYLVTVDNNKGCQTVIS